MADWDSWGGVGGATSSRTQHSHASPPTLSQGCLPRLCTCVLGCPRFLHADEAGTLPQGRWLQPFLGGRSAAGPRVERTARSQPRPRSDTLILRLKESRGAGSTADCLVAHARLKGRLSRHSSSRDATPLHPHPCAFSLSRAGQGQLEGRTSRPGACCPGPWCRPGVPLASTCGCIPPGACTCVRAAPGWAPCAPLVVCALVCAGRAGSHAAKM